VCVGSGIGLVIFTGYREGKHETQKREGVEDVCHSVYEITGVLYIIQGAPKYSARWSFRYSAEL
jgi:hypothetical protein